MKHAVMLLSLRTAYLWIYYTDAIAPGYFFAGQSKIAVDMVAYVW